MYYYFSALVLHQTFKSTIFLFGNSATWNSAWLICIQECTPRLQDIRIPESLLPKVCQRLRRHAISFTFSRVASSVYLLLCSSVVLRTEHWGIQPIGMKTKTRNAVQIVIKKLETLLLTDLLHLSPSVLFFEINLRIHYGRVPSLTVNAFSCSAYASTLYRENSRVLT